MEAIGIWLLVGLLVEQFYAREHRALTYRRRQLWGWMKGLVHRG